jgi:predicted phage terminase large subunit-like protein
MTLAAIEQINSEMLKVVKNKPTINSTDELYTWKEDVWERQYHVDKRIQDLFQNELTTNDEDVFYDTIIYNPYIPHVPYFTQIELLTSAFTHETALFGGGRGGGKTDTLLIGAVQFSHEFPQWKSGILRLTHKHLSRLGAVLDRARKWFELPYLVNEGLAPKWDREANIFKFPNGSGLMFGHVQHDRDVDIYQGAELHRLELDEAVQFTQYKITALKGSLRKEVNDPLPINFWFSGNPGGIAHDYFNTNHVKGPKLFIPSLYTDNPYLNHIQYRSFLDEIADEDPIKGLQWINGDWEAVPEGLMFKREWFTKNTYSFLPEEIVAACRLWDLAATDPEDPTKPKNPDATAGCFLLKGVSGKAYIDDFQHFKKDPSEADDLIIDQIKMDGRKLKNGNQILHRLEQEGGASPLFLINRWSLDLPGYDFDGHSIHKKSKIERAQSMLKFIKHGNMKMKEDPSWNTTFLNEIGSFPTKGIHDDMVDALSGAFYQLFMVDDEEVVPEVAEISIW